MPSQLFDQPADTQLAAPGKPTTAILLGHSRETIAKKIAASQLLGANDDYETIKVAWWSWVKVRTGIEKTEKELTEESKKYIAAVKAQAKDLIEFAAPEEKRLLGIKEAKEAEQARLEQERLEKRYEARLFRVDSLDLAMSESELRGLDDAAFEAALVRLVEAARLKKEEDDRRRLEKEQIAKDRAELEEQRAKQQAKIDAEDARLEQQRREQREAQATIDAEKQRLADEAAERAAAEGAQVVAAAKEEERLHDDAMNAELNAEMEIHRRKHDDKIAAETWRDAQPDDDGSGITVTRASQANEGVTQPIAEAAPSGTADQLPASFVSPSLFSSPSAYQPDVQKVQWMAKVIRGLPYPTVQSEAARSFLFNVQHKLKVIAEECEAYQ